MADNPTGRDFGRLEAQVDALDSKFDKLSQKLDAMSERIESLNHLAERGKGAYWAATLIASAIGAAIVYVLKGWRA